MFERDKIQVFVGRSNPRLGEAIANEVGVHVGDVTLENFPDGEINFKINENVRGADVFIVQSTCPPVNESMIELLIMIDAFKRASAARITAVIPYFGYARKDRKDEGRVPISAKVMANCLEAAGVNRVVSMDLHAAQIQGFFDIPVDHLYGSAILGDYLLEKKLKNCVIVGPDVGSIKRARAYAKILDADLAIIDKERISAVSVRSATVIGDVKNKTVILTDDLISTGGTIVEAVKTLRNAGAIEVYVMATHGVFAGHAVEKLKGIEVKEFIVTDTIPPVPGVEQLGVSYLSTAHVFAEAIKRIHSNESVSSLFDI